MDTYVSANGKEGNNLSRHSIVKKLKGCYQYPGVEIVRALPQLPTKPSDSLGPVTPDSIREGGDHADVCWSPVSSLPRTLCFNSQQYGNLVYSNEGSPRTPKGLVFNPFAPGPDELMLAPQCKKYLGDSRTKVMRQLNFEELLNFDNSVDHTDNMGSVSEDEMLFESLYNSLLEFISSKQTEGLQAKASTPLSDSDGYKTPSCAPRLSRVADTCPDAPRRPANRFKNIDKGLCKKLTF